MTEINFVYNELELPLSRSEIRQKKYIMKTTEMKNQLKKNP